jgi:hypothetical protein
MHSFIEQGRSFYVGCAQGEDRNKGEAFRLLLEKPPDWCPGAAEPGLSSENWSNTKES